MVQSWPRPNYTAGGGEARIALIALSQKPIPDPLPISRKQHGMPEEGEGPGAVGIATRERAANPAWFADHVVAPFADLIASDLGPDAAAGALAADYVYVIEGELADPDDLGHVQAAWAIAKCVCEEGAAIVIDVYAARAHLGVEIAALRPERPFDIMHEVTLFFDEQPTGTLAAWSLGLCKFGRPDLVLLDVTPETATDAALLLRDLAGTLASGERIEPGDRLAMSDGRTLVASRFDPEAAPIVAVEGAALLLSQASEG